eukprot:1161223-Pelagomonas_calceolata.AAC.13
MCSHLDAAAVGRPCLAGKTCPWVPGPRAVRSWQSASRGGAVRRPGPAWATPCGLCHMWRCARTERARLRAKFGI